MSFADILRSLEMSEEQRLASKLPSWAGLRIEVPSSLNLQQCSGESAARYKASLVQPGARVADLTGGLGADSWAFSLVSSCLWFNERDTALLDAVKRNFTALGVSDVVFNNFDIAPGSGGWQDSLRAFAPDLIYLDPARRNAAGKKVFLMEDCSPDVVALMPLLLEIAPAVMVKVSPMADITMLRRRLEPWLREIHVVGAEGECKELLCLCRPEIFVSPDRVLVRLAEDGFVFQAGREQKGILLFVPSPALTKSCLGPGICRIAFDGELSHFGKFYEVVEDLPFSSSVIRELGRRYPVAEVTARGVQLSSEDLRRRLGVKPSGPVHIFACSLEGERRIIVCEKV